MLGLRLVKKTVNQDDPTVYHLFYADEQGDAGSDLTFFEYPGAPEGRAGDGMIHTVGWRVGSTEALDFWAERLRAARRRVEERTTRSGSRFADPEGLRHELRVSTVADQPLIADHPEVPKEMALQGFDGARAYSADPEASRELFEEALAFEPIDDGWEARGESRGGIYVFDEPPGRARAPGRRHRPPHRLGLADRRARAWRERAIDGGRPPDPGDRPLLLPLDLLPRAERRAVRDRHARARASPSTSRSRRLGEKLSLPPDYEHLREQVEPNADARSPTPARPAS